MKAEELMIGDWVSQKHSGLLLKVREIRPPYILADKEEGQFCEDTLEPIPMTEDIIEAHGFMKIPQPKCHFPHHWALDQTSDDDEEAFIYSIKAFNTVWRGMRIDIRNCIEDTILSVQCEFVHELQHALRLCGINLEIKL